MKVGGVKKAGFLHEKTRETTPIKIGGKPHKKLKKSQWNWSYFFLGRNTPLKLTFWTQKTPTWKGQSLSKLSCLGSSRQFFQCVLDTHSVLKPQLVHDICCASVARGILIQEQAWPTGPCFVRLILQNGGGWGSVVLGPWCFGFEFNF